MNLIEVGSVFGCVVLAAAFGVWRFLRIAPSLGLIDRPNERSQHSHATPVGAGVVSAIVFALGLWLWVPSPAGMTPSLGLYALLVVGVALLGLLDDRLNLPSLPRLLAYLMACGAVVYLGLPGASLGVVLMLTLFFTWHVNAYNFMDGIDGLASTQALVVASGLGIVSYYSNLTSPVLPWICVLLVAALLPLWVINWPPARVFMGDSGAISVALALVIIAILALRESLSLLAIWWILMAPFLTDATVTLLIRLVQGNMPHIAHREHAYQRLARRTGSALTVTLGLLVMHLIWQFPLAVAAFTNPEVIWIPVILAPIPSLAVVARMRRSA